MMQVSLVVATNIYKERYVYAASISSCCHKYILGKICVWCQYL